MRNLYIDFDGVIVDTLTKPYKKMKKIGIDINNQKEKQNYLSKMDWNKLLKKPPIINDSIKCIKKIIKSKKFNVFILTHVNTLEEAEEKIKFIKKYIKDIIIIPTPKNISKTQMVNAKNSILIDDYAGNLREWRDKGGISIRFSLELEDKGFLVIKKLDQVLDF